MALDCHRLISVNITLLRLIGRMDYLPSGVRKARGYLKLVPEFYWSGSRCPTISLTQGHPQAAAIIRTP